MSNFGNRMSISIGGDVATQEVVSRKRIEELARWTFGEVPWPVATEGEERLGIEADIEIKDDDGPTLTITFDGFGGAPSWSRTFVPADAS